MTEKERFIKTLKREKVDGLVPTFELVFYLTMEKFGKVHPSHRGFAQWNQMSAKEQEMQINDAADVYIETARAYGHSAIFPQSFHHADDTFKRFLRALKHRSNDEFYVCIHGDPTYAIPNGDDMIDFSVRMYEEPEKLLEEQFALLYSSLKGLDEINKEERLVDGIAMCSDYSFNANPFYSPEIFGDIIAPVLQKSIQEYHDRGLTVIKHTDGNINPILDQIVECGPDAIHSLDPQGGVNLDEVIKKYGDRVALCGNVNCGLLQTGTLEQVEQDVLRCLNQGMQMGKGFVFCTSNCVYTGLDLERYEFMNALWRKHGMYK